LGNIIPDYKATHRYLSRIEEYQKQAKVEAVITLERKEAERLKQLQDKENAENQAALQNLVQKASAINDDIIRLSVGQDYGAMKVKFAELEKTVAALTMLKHERQRQKKLAEALERQKRLYEADRLLQLSKGVNISNATKEITAPSPSKVGTPPNDTMRKQLEARRAVVRKKLEDGVEAMYQEALSLYKHGNYTAAADKFKDVQDILPGYKRSGQYMDEARRKSLTFQSVITLNASAVPSSSPVAREDSISKTLDLFDSNVQ